jgi:hypothetical protein
MSNLRTGLHAISRNFIESMIQIILSAPLADLRNPLRNRSESTSQPAAKSARQESLDANFEALYGQRGTLTEEKGKFVVRTATRTYTSARRRDAIRRARKRGIELTNA